MNEEIKAAGEFAKDPLAYSTITIVGVFALSVCGGMVRVIREIQFGGKRWYHIIAIFMGELFISCFVGFNTFMLCESMEIDRLKTAVLVSVGSYMGGRSLSALEWLWNLRFGRAP